MSSGMKVHTVNSFMEKRKKMLEPVDTKVDKEVDNVNNKVNNVDDVDNKVNKVDKNVNTTLDFD